MSVAAEDRIKQLAPVEFLRLLYGDESPGHLVVWTLEGKETTWFSASDLKAADGAIVELARSRNVYTGVALQDKLAALAEAERRERERAEAQRRGPATVEERYVRGYSSTASTLPGLVYEIDIAAGGNGTIHKKQNLAPTLEAALEVVDGFPLKPTTIIHSGHGIHCWYLFREPWVFEDAAERRDAEDLAWTFQETLHERVRARGWDADSISDLARVLRPPETFNRKGGEPVPVRVLRLDEQARYSTEDFERHLLDVTGERTRPRTAVNLPDDLPRVDLDSLRFQLRIAPWLRELIVKGYNVDRETGEIRLPSRSERLWEALCQLVRCRFDNATIAAICLDPRYSISEKALEKRDPRAWLAPQIGKARDEVKRTDLIPPEVDEGAPEDDAPADDPAAGSDESPDRAADSNEQPADERPEPRPGGPGKNSRETAFACQVLTTLRKAANAAEALRVVLETPATLGALALAADLDPGGYQALLMQLRNAADVKVRDVQALEKAVNQARRNRKRFRVVRPDETPDQTRVADTLADAPVPAAAVVPDGWTLSRSGIARRRTQGDEDGGSISISEPVASAPIVIVGRLKDALEGTEAARVAHWRDGRWQHHTADRAALANARALVDLAAYGLPVTSGNAGEVVHYLADFEAANLEHLPRAQVSRQMGWQGQGASLGFLCGRTLIRPDGEQDAAVDLDELAPEDWREDWVAFRGADGGDEQLADGFAPSGSFDEWRRAIKTLSDYPRVLLAIYASLTPPMLPILDAPNFVIDWAFATSTGKSTTLRAGASCWGNPDERAPAAALGTWDATRVWIERASAVLNALPLILDDTKRAKTPKVVAQTIYDVSSGKGRGRGSPRGMRRAGNWCTVLLSSGETPITSFTEDGGTRTRALSLWGLPFGRADAETAAVVHRLNLAIRQHHGHAGPGLVRYILQRRDQWPEWREEYFRIQGAYLERANGDPLSGRFAAYFAALDMTAAIAHAALDLPWSYRDPVEALWRELVAGAGEGDRALAALAHVVSWANGHQADFWGRHAHDREGSPRQPGAGWAGRWDGEDEGWDYLAFLPHRLKGILSEAGFEPDPIQRLWRDRGWLLLDRSSNNLQTRVHDAKPRVVAITREAVKLVEGGDG